MHYHLYRIQLNFSRNKFFPSIDANGNLVFHRAEKPALDRRLCWDEENRLMGVADNSYTSFYQYDAAGERTYKLTGEQHKQIVNGQTYTYGYLDNPTLYASPYLVATPRGYTKHYYAESERIASKIGGGELKEICMSLNLEKDFNKKDEPEYPDLLDCDEMPEKMLYKLKKNEELLNRIVECLEANSNIEYSLLKYLYELRHELEDEKHLFFYHPDHLGSSSWITYTDGKSIQHLHYLPFGESFVDQRVNGYFAARYTFSAKEKDTETGYGYFGARYYSSDLSIWISVDPMADKYPTMSAYVYCANNPVKLVDPNGREVIITGEGAEEAVDQLQGTSKNLTFSRDSKTGKLSVEGKARTWEERLVKRSINSSRVRVHVKANYNNLIDNEPNITHRGGAFLGNVIVEEKGARPYAIANQTINPEMLCEDFDNHGKFRGESVRHEITEAFLGGLISLRRNKPASVAIPSIKNRIYDAAHNRATPQPDYNNNNIVPPPAEVPQFQPYQRKNLF